MFLLRILPLYFLAITVYAATPAAASISYQLIRNGTPIGVISENFEVKDGAYTVTSVATATGLLALAQRRPVTYTSTGDSTKQGLRPARFEGRRGNAVVTAEFDWKSDTLTMIHDGLNQTVALPPATQDRLSIMYQLMHLVQIQPQPLRTVEFTMTSGRKIDRYRYDVNVDVAVDTPLKRLTTLHLVKQREAGDTQTEIWLAPEFHYLPVKIVIVEDDGVRYEQVVTRLEVKF
jgi:hypothetical protein